MNERVQQHRETADPQAPGPGAAVAGPKQAELSATAATLNGAPRVLQLAAMVPPVASSARPNRTGLPDVLKAGVESLSGMALDHVRVHYNSAKPAQLNALAYAQGRDIHLGPGQERHLPHEAWHVVQQAQGRVHSTMQMNTQVLINDDAGLELEADVMGAKALSTATQRMPTTSGMRPIRPSHMEDSSVSQPQRIDYESSTLVAQLEETLSQRIKRILLQRGIRIGDEDSEGYASQLLANPPNTPIAVLCHYRALKLNAVGVVSSVEWRPPSDASKMRVSSKHGPMNESDSSMLTPGPRPLTGILAQHDISISAASFSDIGPRAQLRSVMGGSAAALSGVENSEWLHMVAHSLGGPDEKGNIVAGPHSLNTAMIPFERFVRSAAREGKLVDYGVTFFSDVQGEVVYVRHVEIHIKFPEGEGFTWTLSVSDDRKSEPIDGQVLAEIQQAVNSFGGELSPQELKSDEQGPA